jgi:hypothetical protein
MHHIEIERSHRRSVKHRADATHDDEINAVARQNPQYFQEPGIGILHGV